MPFAILIYRDEAEDNEFDEQLEPDRIIGPFDTVEAAFKYGQAYAEKHGVEWDIPPMTAPEQTS